MFRVLEPWHLLVLLGLVAPVVVLTAMVVLLIRRSGR